MSNSIRISAPDTAAQGEVIELKAMIRHKMESGYRRDMRGAAIPRDIIVLFECLYDDEVVFKANMSQGISANPFLSFYTRATETGVLTFRWTDQDGETWEDTHTLTVT